MNQSKFVKIVVFVPASHSDVVREAMGKAGAGKVRNYTFCSFSSKGIGRFKPGEGAHPFIGDVSKLVSVEEERIEMGCSRDLVLDVIDAIKKIHPYEEVVVDIYPLEEI